MSSIQKSNRGKTGRGNRQINPPQIQSNVINRHIYRFTSTSGVAKVIGVNQLLFAAGSMGKVVNSSVEPINSAIKVHRVSIWTPPASQGSAASCAIEWTSTNFGPQTEVSDTSVSTAIVAHVSSSPPAGSDAAFWNSIGSGSASLFTLTAPTGSVIDIDMSTVLTDTGAVSGLAGSVATATIGVLYYMGMPVLTAPTYVPVSLTTTT